MEETCRVRDFGYFLAASAAKNCKKMAVIKSAASAASAQGGCASSRLDHGLKFYVIQGGCASSRLINGFSDCVSSTRSGPLQEHFHLSCRPLSEKSSMQQAQVCEFSTRIKDAGIAIRHSREDILFLYCTVQKQI